jgi:hypothetical protein
MCQYTHFRSLLLRAAEHVSPAISKKKHLDEGRAEGVAGVLTQILNRQCPSIFDL